MQLKEPVFVLGTGRSGSTAFFEAFTFHPRVAYLSSLNERYFDKPRLNRIFLSLINVPYIGIFMRQLIHSSEAYTFWEHNFKGFRTPCRDLRSDDVTSRSASRLIKALGCQLTKKRNRFFTKITGWPRIGLLQEIFPDAKFVHIIRDGRAVANSLLGVNYWWGWRGPENWRLGPLSHNYDEEWRKYDRSFIALAGIYWKILVDAIETSKAVIPKDQFIDIKYEDLCAKAVDVYRKTINFAGLEWTAAFESRTKKNFFVNTNYKWRENLNTEQQKILLEVLSGHLEKYGYTDD